MLGAAVVAVQDAVLGPVVDASHPGAGEAVPHLVRESRVGQSEAQHGPGLPLPRVAGCEQVGPEAPGVGVRPSRWDGGKGVDVPHPRVTTRLHPGDPVPHGLHPSVARRGVPRREEKHLGPGLRHVRVRVHEAHHGEPTAHEAVQDPSRTTRALDGRVICRRVHHRRPPARGGADLVDAVRCADEREGLRVGDRREDRRDKRRIRVTGSLQNDPPEHVVVGGHDGVDVETQVEGVRVGPHWLGRAAQHDAVPVVRLDDQVAPDVAEVLAHREPATVRQEDLGGRDEGGARRGLGGHAPSQAGRRPRLNQRALGHAGLDDVMAGDATMQPQGLTAASTRTDPAHIPIRGGLGPDVLALFARPAEPPRRQGSKGPLHPTGSTRRDVASHGRGDQGKLSCSRSRLTRSAAIRASTTCAKPPPVAYVNNRDLRSRCGDLGRGAGCDRQKVCRGAVHGPTRRGWLCVGSGGRQGLGLSARRPGALDWRPQHLRVPPREGSGRPVAVRLRGRSHWRLRRRRRGVRDRNAHGRSCRRRRPRSARPPARGVRRDRHLDHSGARGSAAHSWEIYGDPTPNPADIVTTVLHLLS